jgi:hypothetical protein
MEQLLYYFLCIQILIFATRKLLCVDAISHNFPTSMPIHESKLCAENSEFQHSVLHIDIV